MATTACYLTVKTFQMARLPLVFGRQLCGVLQYFLVLGRQTIDSVLMNLQVLINFSTEHSQAEKGIITTSIRFTKLTRKILSEFAFPISASYCSVNTQSLITRTPYIASKKISQNQSPYQAPQLNSPTCPLSSQNLLSSIHLNRIVSVSAFRQFQHLCNLITIIGIGLESV
jgi:hypothetical protein